MEFGKFHGHTLGQIAAFEPSYIDWVSGTVTGNRTSLPPRQVPSRPTSTLAASPAGRIPRRYAPAERPECGELRGRAGTGGRGQARGPGPWISPRNRSGSGSVPTDAGTGRQGPSSVVWGTRGVPIDVGAHLPPSLGTLGVPQWQPGANVSGAAQPGCPVRPQKCEIASRGPGGDRGRARQSDKCCQPCDLTGPMAE